MRIQHNIMAMNAYRNYTNNTSAVSKNLEKLSSGYKINRAGDDAAGLAISEKMRAQITGLKAASKNVKDGVSLVKTAEGAMQEIHDMLNRMESLATQSANGTYDNEVDRANLQKEVKSLKEEINRIADSANFNGIKLLDGSLDSKSIREDSVTTGGVNNMFNLPDVGDNLGVDTILHKNPTGVGKTSFSVNFGNQTFENQEGDKLTLTLGEGDNAVEMVLEGTADGKGMQAEDIAKALAEKYGDGGAEKLMLKDADGNEQEFTVTLGDNGYSLKFEQVNDPMSDGQVVEAPRSVKIEGTAGNVTPPPAPDADPGEKGVYSYDITTAFAAGDKLTIAGKDIIFGITDDPDNNTINAGANNTAELQAAKIAELFKDDANWTVQTDYEAKLAANPADTSGDILVEQKIKNEEGIGQISQADVTTVGAAAAAANAPAAVDQGTGANAAKSASWTVSIDKVFAAGDKLVLSDGTNTAEIKFVSGTATATNGEIQIDAADDAKTLATKIETLLATPANVANFGALGFTITAEKDANGVNTGNLLIKQSTAGQGNAEDLKISVGRTDTVTGAGTFATVTAPKDPEVVDAPDTPNTPTMTPSKDYLVDVSTINQGAPASNTRLASTVFELTDDIIKDGNILKIGDQTFTVKLSADTEAVEGTELLDLSNLAEGADVLHEAAIKLSNATANNSVFESNGYDGNKVSFLENKSKNLNADGSSKVDLSTFDKVKEQFMYGTAEQVTEAKMGSALTLQIGDTSDSFNQMKVNVGDMHTKAMVYEDKDGNTTSIEDIDIGTQDGATKAVDVIKNAINYVSGVRGDLGAIQNRLEHTANNLSVMAENIQDAESAIRDTDIAEEMMAYTKNNILVQSAQAMLAQANQVPQGVLQLLG